MLPDRLEAIGEQCFSGSGLESVELPAALRTVGQAAFAECESLRSVKFGEGLEVLGTDALLEWDGPMCGAFEGSALEEVALPSTLKRIKHDTFKGCKNLKSVRLPEGLEHIERGAFQGAGLERAEIPASLRSIEQRAFSQCRDLTYARFDKGLEVLGTNEYPQEEALEKYGGVFEGSALERADLPSTLRRIEHDVFRDCGHLRSIDLPDGLEHIGERCFQESALESVALPRALRTVAESTFYKCESLGEVAFQDGLEEIGPLAFSKTCLADVKFPASLRKIAHTAFSQCAHLRAVEFGEGMEVLRTGEWSEEDISWPGIFTTCQLEEVRLPSTLKQIEPGVFRGCKNLKSISLPNGLERIGKYCFLATGLERIELPGSLRTISQGAFAGCESLKCAKFGEGLEALGTDKHADGGKGWHGVFEGSALENVQLPSTLKRLERRAFKECKSLKSIELPEKLEHIGEFCF